MFTSWSEQSTPAELSMASVLILPPAMRELDPAAWVRPRLPPSPTTLARRSPPLSADAVVGLVADLGVRLVGRLHVGADAAVPEQVDGRPQDRPDAARPARATRPAMSSTCLASGESATRFADRAKTPPPGEITDAVVVGPGRTRQRRTAACARQRTASGPGRDRGRCAGGRRRRRASDARDSSMPLPNTSPDMSPMPTTVSGSRLGVDAEIAEMARTETHAPRAVMPIALWS